ncbi:STAS domain-containing protein [Actinomadura atramentaria]|uniref:STAS domain-containing protein n=1 Tax=Actinomadura atramentaria TaxID=1990 RepID=UPI000381FF79|nr:STAS domain-containing protein [Actinomadura atramentaria]
MALSVPPARRGTVHAAESWQIVRIRGELDCTRADLLRALVDAALDPARDPGASPGSGPGFHAARRPCSGGPPRLALDLADVPFCDSYGLSALVYAAKRVRAAGGSLRVEAASRQVRSLIRRCGLDCLLPLPD